MNLITALRALAGVLVTLFVGLCLIVLSPLAATAAPVAKSAPAPARCIASVSIPSKMVLEDSTPHKVTASLLTNAQCAHTIRSLHYIVQDQNGLPIKSLTFDKRHTTADFYVVEPGEYTAVSDDSNRYGNADVTGLNPRYGDSNVLRAKVKSRAILGVRYGTKGAYTLDVSADHYNVDQDQYVPWTHAKVTLQIWKADSKWHTVGTLYLNAQGVSSLKVFADHMTGARALFHGTIYTWGQANIVR